MNAVDTNVFVYSLDKHEPAKQQKARDLLHQLDIGSATTILLWQVIGEFIQRLRRWRDQRKLSESEFQQHIAVYRKFFPLILPTPAVLDHALDLTTKYSLSHWDSMLLGACLDAGVTTLYTEDMGSPRTIAGIQLVNPFI
jgi:predicted nucleic acid-binding protein